MALAQLFTVNEPLNGVSHIAISAVYLYFKTASSTSPVDVYIREVANGTPTYQIVRNSKKTVRPSDKYANGASVLRTSADASGWTQFLFPKPVLLNTQQQYALFVKPHFNDPVYQLWTAKLNDVDTRSQVPIQFNQSIGPLFRWEAGDRTATTNEAIKFLIKKVTTQNNRHFEDHYGFNEEHVVVNDLTGPFITNELCFISDEVINLAKITPTTGSNANLLINGEAFYQSNNSGGNIATGFIYSANVGTVLLNKIQGQLDISTTANPIIGVSSGILVYIANAVVSVNVTSTSNNITLPFTGNASSTMFYPNQSISLSTSDTSINELFIVSAISTDKVTLTLSWTPSFSDTDATLCKIRGDNLGLHANWQGYDATKFNNFVATFNNSTANTQINSNYHFGNSTGAYIFGQLSQSRCTSYETIDLEYHNVVPHFNIDKCPENEHKFYWGGYKKSVQWNPTYPNSWRFKK